MKETLKSQYDVIVIGSGIGGLTAALLHAKFGKQKVLLIEQHFQLGGLIQSFSRGKYTWNAGLHYLGAMQAGTFPRKIMDVLTRGQVVWQTMPDPFEVFHYPKFSMAQPRGLSCYIETLKNAFPDESGLEAYFLDLRRAHVWGILQFASKVLPRFLAWLPRLVARLGWGRYRDKRLIDSLDEHFEADDIKAVLSGQCGDYGLSPAQASLFIHATLFFHYEGGGYCPEGGAQSLIKAIVSHLEALGVDLVTGHRVNEICVQKARVQGVHLTPVQGEKALGPRCTIRAGQVVSAVGARNTYLQLIDQKWISRRLRETLQHFPAGASMVVAYLGLSEDPAKLGLMGENHWFYQSSHLDELDQQLTGQGKRGVPVVFASFDRLVNADGETIHTATLIAPAGYQSYLDCGDKGQWKKRSPAYETMKSEQRDLLLNLVEKQVPGFKGLVDRVEVSTPLSFEYFSLHPQGEIYGLPAIPERYQIPAFGPRTPIKGLTLAGVDSISHGVVGAMVGGLTAFTSSLGGMGVMHFFRKLSRIDSYGT